MVGGGVCRRYWSNLGSVLFHSKRYQEAIDCYTKAAGSQASRTDRQTDQGWAGRKEGAVACSSVPYLTACWLACWLGAGWW